MLASLEADRRRILVLEIEILKLQQALSALQTEKDPVQGRLDAYRYPVLILPNEIISEIFLWFIPPYPDELPLAGSSSPTILTHICRKWREIALATPQLWRTIVIDEQLRSREVQGDIAETWMRRSKSLPLSVHVNNYLGTSPALPSLIPGAARWEHLSLVLWDVDSQILSNAMPLLRQLHLHVDDEINTVVCGDMPLLRTVHLALFAIGNVALPWAQLTSLSLEGAYMGEFGPILLQTPNLVHLSLEIIAAGDDIDFSEIRLLCLQTCDLDSSELECPEVLNTLIAPALRSLRLPEQFLGDDDPINILQAFISRSQCKLDSLSIMSTLTPLQSYRRAFPSIPEIVCSLRLPKPVVDSSSGEDD
ncbi:F-box domain-containing protein [Favolaschia claudopus]|uniref:F-box domain-containing protein n=1 Tax=Favolaschia claudopus TaxID=2862362 RepID=A0AAW0AP50_9AGAR